MDFIKKMPRSGVGRARCSRPHAEATPLGIKVRSFSITVPTSVRSGCDVIARTLIVVPSNGHQEIMAMLVIGYEIGLDAFLLVRISIGILL
jgi:hypothetical protein